MSGRDFLYRLLRARYDARVSHFRAADAELTKQQHQEVPDTAFPFALPEEARESCQGKLISVIIPSKDHPELLRTCISSLQKTLPEAQSGLSVEIIVVDNGSNTKNRSIINEIINGANTPDCPCRYLYREEEFSFSRMCNAGAAEAKGTLLLFFNDDVEALKGGWLETMAACALSEGVGAVGAKLLYPGEEHRIQHAGIVNTQIGPVHCLHGMRDETFRADHFHQTAQCVIAVTGACLMIRKDLFLQSGSFREALPVAFNDVDLCYSLHEAGYTNVCCNQVTLTHHESLSRGDDTKDTAKMLRLTREYRTLMEAHLSLAGFDPYRKDDLLSAADLFSEKSANGASGEELIRAVPPKPLPKGARHDRAARVGVEYANRLLLALKKEDTERAKDREALFDYYIRGYSFVIGADNACYKRKLILQRIGLDETGAFVPEGDIMTFRVLSFYRLDIVKNAPDQLNHALCGFQTRIRRGVLTDGVYRVGILALRRFSRQKIYDWGETILYVDDGRTDIQGSI